MRTHTPPPHTLLIVHIVMAPEVALGVMDLATHIEGVGQVIVAEAKSFATGIKGLLMVLPLLRSLILRFMRRRRRGRPTRLG
jgi:hypothetical protein